MAPILPPVFPGGVEAAELRNGSRVVALLALQGLAATSVMAVGSLAVGWIAPASQVDDHPLVSSLRQSDVGTGVAKLAVIIGVAWMLRLWVTSGHLLRGLSVSDSRRVGMLALLWSAPFLVAPVLFSRDVFSYIALSRLQSEGINPFEHGTGALPTYLSDGADPLWANSPAPYGPLWMLLSGAVFGLTGAEPTSALLVFRLLAIVGIVLLIVFVPQLAELAGADPGTAVWLSVLNPMVLFHLSASAHNDALMVGLMLAGLTMALHGRLGLGVLLVTAAGMVKVPALVLLPFVAVLRAGLVASWWRRVSAAATVATQSVATMAVLTLLAGLGTGWVANLSTPSKVDTWLSPVTAIGRTLGALTEAAEWGASESVLGGFRVVGLVATAALLCWLVCTASRRTIVRGAALAMLALVALGPVVQPWYLLWLLPLMAVAVADPREQRWIVGASVGLSVYSVANTAATTASWAALDEGIAALVAVGIVAAVLMVSRRAREILVAPSRAALADVRAA